MVRLTLRGDANPLDAAARLARIYLPYIPDPKGMTGPFGLTQYGFANNSGYGREELFAGEKDGKLMLFLCERQSPELPSPNCLATDQPLGKSRESLLSLQACLPGALARIVQRRRIH